MPPARKASKAVKRVGAPRPRPKPIPAKGDGKMQTIYLRPKDIERANELEYRVKKTQSIPGRIGLSLMVRVALKLLADEFAKNEKHGLQLVKSIAEGGE